MIQEELEALATELAGMETECPCWRVIDRNEGRTGTIRKAPDPACPRCHGTGKVPLFPTVRVPCDSQEYRDDGDKIRHLHNMGVGREPTEVKGCPGWIPSHSFVTWCWAVIAAEPKSWLCLAVNGVSFVWHDAPSWAADAEAVLTALAQKEQHDS